MFGLPIAKEVCIKFLLVRDGARLPKRATPTSACFDLYASDGVAIAPNGGFALVHTGLKMEMPESFYAEVYPRSGMSISFPNYLANNVGIIDSDYRGEIMVPVVNWTDSWMGITNQDRIAQILFHEKVDAEISFVVGVPLSDTLRGDGGFGSTGRA